MRIELDEGLELVNASLVEARRSIFALRPLPLEEYGLVAALRELAQGFSEYYPVQTIFEVEGAERQLPRALEMTLFSVAQEALNNVVKHAQADTAWIHLDLRPVDAILLFVGDNGSGFDPAALAGQAQSLHFGLSGMRQRVKQANGHLLICSQPGEGSEISVILPIQDDQP
jgi:signal transduction histidine kinase